MGQRVMTANSSSTNTRRARRRRNRAQEATPQARQQNLLIVAWVVTFACAYLAFGGSEPSPGQGISLLIIAGMIMGNLVIGKSDAKRVVSPLFGVGVAAVYSLLLLGAWQLGGQASIALLVCAIALLDLALVGLTLAELLFVMLAMAGVFLAIH